MRSKLTYPNVASTIALFLALGGGAAFAASKIHSNDIAHGAVQTNNLHARAVSAGKLGLGAVHSNQIIDHAVNTEQLAPGAVGSAQISKGAVEPSNMSYPVQLAASPMGGSLAAPVGSEALDYPFANGSWAQKPGQVQLIIGAADGKVAFAGGFDLCEISAIIELNGQGIGFFRFGSFSTSFEHRERELLIPIADPPAPRTNHLTAKVRSNEECLSGTAINSVRFRVITLG